MLSFFKHHPYSPASTIETLDCLNAFATAGEMLSLSFSISSREPIADLKIVSSELRSATAVIPPDSVNLYIVKIWEQAGIGVYQSAAVRVGELLLKDDRAEIRDGYTRRGKCRHWKHLLRRSQIYRPPELDLNGDAHTSLDVLQSKQVWVSVKIPRHAAPGFYQGQIIVKSGDGAHPIGILKFQVEVLPIKLLEPEQDLFIWYKGTLDCHWTQHYLQEDIFRAQLQDIYDHGFRSISLNEDKPELLQQAIDIAHSIGFSRNVVITARNPEILTKIDFKQLTPIYYISDKVDAEDEGGIAAHIAKWRRVKTLGGRTMSSLMRQGFARRFYDNDDVGCAPDVLSYYLPTNLTYFQARSEFEELREREESYYWQSHMEKPDVHRVLAGLYLWKSKADGIAPYCYQHLPKPPNSPFDDFDEWDFDECDFDEWEPDNLVGLERHRFKDHMTTYPARSGSIPTLQWKALTDGIYDLRYLITFYAALKRVANYGTREAKRFAEMAQMRCETFLKGISLTGINITSKTNSAPYQELTSEDLAGFRGTLAHDIVTLTELPESVGL